ncbi:SulP family inorganic anion transporter [Methylibium sp.]|uniref:SulP family inorganic anion transporter n=1 Tax=Methylibium sp. TaxID=2067992 RepID=UPI003D137D4F
MTSPPAPAALPLLRRCFGPWVAEVSRHTLRADLLAGLLGAVLVLPQGIAFATLAGLPPQYGLATAILPCIVAALFGSSRHVMSGPTNANSLALAAMLTPLAWVRSPDYIELALTVTLLVGVMQTLIGALRLGSIANFISPAALLGFTTGAALLIVLHALPDLFGLSTGGHVGSTLSLALTRPLEAVHPGALVVSALTLAVTLAARQWRPRWPALLLGLAAGTLGATLLNAGHDDGTFWHVEQIGELPLPWPQWHWPRVDVARLPDLVGIAFALTLVALAQSISIAKAVAARSGQRIDANREFFGQGLSNLAGGLSSAYVSCGSLNRSLPNFEAGAQTPLAAVFSALLLLLLVLASAPLLALIPNAAIAAVLLPVAWSLLDLPGWHRLVRLERSDFAIAAATAVATVSLRLEIAILLGSILSLSSYLQRTARPAMRTMGFDSVTPGRPFVVLDGQAGALPECPQLKLLRMEGAVYFGAAQHVSDTLHHLRDAADAPRHLLVMSKSMNFIDPAGAQVWSEELRSRRALGGDLYFHRPRPPVLELWERAGFLDVLGRDHIFADKHSAIARIVPRLDPGICARCRVRIFSECDQQPGAALAPEI